METTWPEFAARGEEQETQYLPLENVVITIVVFWVFSLFFYPVLWGLLKVDKLIINKDIIWLNDELIRFPGTEWFHLTCGILTNVALEEYSRKAEARDRL